VAVVLGYYNGEEFLEDQIRSIARQNHSALEIFVADDASSRRVPLEALRPAADCGIPVHVARQPTNVGFSRNFLSALAAVPRRFECFAFSDQDDVWFADKLGRAVDCLCHCPVSEPALYCGRTAITDHSGETIIGFSPRPRLSPRFTNALVQNIAGGNTMVFNRAARDVIVASMNTHDVAAYDWWCYQIISGAGGRLIYDPRPCLKYRQHGHNIIGANDSWRERIVRIAELAKGRYKFWNDLNLEALQCNRTLLTPDNQTCLDAFVRARRAPVLQRPLIIHRTGIRRQTPLQNLAFNSALIFGKV
jgi:glycosyltransferase involved in cell wall biosynthesis